MSKSKLKKFKEQAIVDLSPQKTIKNLDTQGNLKRSNMYKRKKRKNISKKSMYYHLNHLKIKDRLKT